MRFPDTKLTASRNGKLYDAVKKSVADIPEPLMYKIQKRIKRMYGIHLSRRLLAIKVTRSINEAVMDVDYYEWELKRVKCRFIHFTLMTAFTWFRTTEGQTFWQDIEEALSDAYPEMAT